MSRYVKSLAEAKKESTLATNDIKETFTHSIAISEIRSQAFSISRNLRGLHLMELEKLASIIGIDDKKVEVFFSLPNDFKVIYACNENELSC